MSKKNETIDEQEVEQTQQPVDTSHADTPPAELSPSVALAELKRDGTTILTATTRDELAEMVNDIPADCNYIAGAVGHNLDTGLFTIRLDLITP